MTIIQKPSTEKLDTKQTTILSTTTSDDSITSTLPWQATINIRRSVRLQRNETGQVNPASFFICMTSVMLLSTGVGISTIAIWTLVHKLPYILLTKDALSIGMSAFTLTASLLSIPCFWMAWISHYSRGNYVFLSLLTILSGFCLIMHAIGGSLGILYKNNMQFDMKIHPPKVLPGQYQKHLKETMLDMLQFEDIKIAWNQVQTRFKCCGVDKYTDWYDIKKELPKSCCSEINCDTDHIYTTGCLDQVAFDLVWDASLISGVSFIGFIIHIFSVCIGCYVAIKKHLLVTSSQENLSYKTSKISCNYSQQ